ncbi:MAG TPA: hypothetical protein ENI07_12570 [Desulfobacterales bacterium]|nr:hypothetical protein [Desulfobacterales bacterium]
MIKTVNELYDNGTRLYGMVKSLNDQGKNKRNGKPWTPTQVKRLITDYRSAGV